jgi:hypothetical protein
MRINRLAASSKIGQDIAYQMQAQDSFLHTRLYENTSGQQAQI